MNNESKSSAKPDQEGKILFSANTKRLKQTLKTPNDEEASTANDQNSSCENGYITKSNLYIQCTSHNNSSNRVHRIKT